MSERAHPDDPDFQDRWVWRRRFRGMIPWPHHERNIWKQGLMVRYKFCQPYARGKRVLDIPCGVGWGTYLLRQTVRLVGVDLSEESIEYARSHYRNKADFVVGNMEHLLFDDRSFDLMICLEGIEHVPVELAERFIQEAARVLSPSGRIILTNPIPDPDRAPNPYHIHEYTQKEFDSLLDPCFKTELCQIRKCENVSIIYYVGQVKGKSS